MTTSRTARGAALHARITAAAGPDGRLPLPDLADWDTLPFEGDLRVRAVEPPVATEPPRTGEDGVDCPSCSRDDADFLWTDAHWRLRVVPEGVFTLILTARAHLDHADLDDALAAELGVLTARLVRAVEGLDGVARCHVNRWGDGGAHFHLWFFARPHGMLQLRGSCLSDWLDLLPAQPDGERDGDAGAVLAALTSMPPLSAGTAG